jgi:catechol 2,3-dioxygenase-like lactoylglutathione lyase family enzyme
MATVEKLDHVALWVADRDPIAEFATARLGMHVIERTERFTLVGADARRGKLTLFEADGPRDRGPLAQIGLRVSALPDGEASFDVGDGLRIALVEAPTDVEYDLDHVTLVVPEPERAAERWLELGFGHASPGLSGAWRVEAGGAYIELQEGTPRSTERPLLNHLGVLVDSADEWRAHAARIGVEVADVVDAENTYAVFVVGPEAVTLEYVEHKPSFSLT